MLQFLSESAKGGLGKIIIFGFIGLGAAGLVLTDVQGFFSGGVSARNVAEVSGTQISVQDFDTRLRLSLYNQGITPQEAHALGYTGQLLQAMVGETIFRKAASEYGLVVPREYVAKELNEMLTGVSNDTLSKEEALARMLRAQNMTEDKFVKNLAMETATKLLNRALFEGVFTPSALARDLKSYDDHTRDIKAVFFKNSDVANIPDPTDEDLRAFYVLRKAFFAIPEYRSFSYTEISTDNLAEQVNISQDDVLAYYESNKDIYTTPIQRQIEQAIVSDAETAREIHAKAIDGLPLKDAVQAVLGNTDTYRESSWFEEAGLLEALSTPAFAAQLGSVIDPVKSPLGWHVAKIIDQKDSETPPLARLESDIRKKLKAEALSDALFELSEEIDDALAGGESLTALAANYALKLKQTPLVTLGGVSKDGEEPFQNLSIASEILAEGFDLSTGESSQLIETAEGSYVALQLTQFQEKGYERFEDVRDRLKDLYFEEERRKITLNKATDFMAFLGNAEDFDTRAQDLGVRVLKITNIKNNNKSQDILTPENIRQVFSLTPEDKTRVFFTPQGNGVMALEDVKLRSIPVLSQDINARQKEIQSGFRETVFQTYMYALFNEYNVDINLHALDRLYGRDEADVF